MLQEEWEIGKSDAAKTINGSLNVKAELSNLHLTKIPRRKIH